jgi:hypothetical protein
MPTNFSKGALKRMDSRNIRWDEIDETLEAPRNEFTGDDFGEPRRMAGEHGLREYYRQDAGLSPVKRQGKSINL